MFKEKLLEVYNKLLGSLDNTLYFKNDGSNDLSHYNPSEDSKMMFFD